MVPLLRSYGDRELVADAYGAIANVGETDCAFRFDNELDRGLDSIPRTLRSREPFTVPYRRSEKRRSAE
jgi:hypothetical protein